MRDLIDRQAAIDALKNDMASLDHIINGMSTNDVRLDAYVSQRNQVNYDIYTINNLPPAQPERIRGHWIESNGLNILMKKFIEKGETWRVCDKCGAGFMIGYQYECDKLYHETFHNFCPKCGAEMEVTK